jgi:hypothetical protein
MTREGRSGNDFPIRLEAQGQVRRPLHQISRSFLCERMEFANERVNTLHPTGSCAVDL